MGQSTHRCQDELRNSAPAGSSGQKTATPSGGAASRNRAFARSWDLGQEYRVIWNKRQERP